MNEMLTRGQAEARMGRAFRWMMKAEPPGQGDNPRWAKFRRIRDRLRPYRLPLRARVGLALAGLASQEPDEETARIARESWDDRTHGLCRRW